MKNILLDTIHFMSDIMDFWNTYDLISSTKSFASIRQDPRKCRFCNRTETEVTFKSEAHALPELLGENKLISQDECDDCNALFGAFESHLSRFFIPYLTVLGVKGKRRVPAFHSRTVDRNEDTRTIFIVGPDGKRSLQIGDFNDYKIDEINKTLSLSFRLPPHRPLFVYKALVKIALSLLPEKQIRDFQNVYDWILGKEAAISYLPVGFITVLKRKKFAKPFADLYQAKKVVTENKFFPELTLLVNFANIIVQIFLPLSQNFKYEDSIGKSPELNIYPSFVLNNDLNEVKSTGKIKYNFTTIDFSSDASVERDEILNFSYESADLNIGRS